MRGPIRIGCAGWTIPKEHASAFPPVGSHLERYAARFLAVEIDSSFYRPHRFETYRRWAATVPEEFAFAVKMPKEVTHLRRLSQTASPVDAFLGQVAGLGGRLGPVLVQLPPSLDFVPDRAEAFFADLRTRFDGDVVCEPRHRRWFARDADGLLARFRIGRVAADPPVVSQAAEPGGWTGIAYFRLHGSPRLYYSSYDSATLATLGRRLADASTADRPCWCIFDNMAQGAATANALALQDRLAITVDD